MTKRFVIHPFLFALYPILTLFSHNIDETAAGQIFLPMGIAIFFTFLFSRFIYRRPTPIRLLKCTFSSLNGNNFIFRKSLSVAPSSCTPLSTSVASRSENSSTLRSLKLTPRFEKYYWYGLYCNKGRKTNTPPLPGVFHFGGEFSTLGVLEIGCPLK